MTTGDSVGSASSSVCSRSVEPEYTNVRFMRTVLISVTVVVVVRMTVCTVLCVVFAGWSSVGVCGTGATAGSGGGVAAITT